MHRWLAAITSVIFLYVSSTSVASGSEFYAQKTKKKKSLLTVEDNPLPNGKPKIVGGILTASIGGGVSLLALFLTLFSYCGMGEEESVQDCRKDQRNQQYLGGRLLLASIGVGVPMIIYGAKERKEWKHWNRENVRGYTWNDNGFEEADLTQSQQLSLLARRDSSQFADNNASQHRMQLRLPLVGYVF